MADIDMKEVGKLLKGSPRDAKGRLASEIVTMYHGAEAASAAEKNFVNVHKEKGTPAEMPEAKVKKGTLLIDVLTDNGLAKSKAEAKRLIEQGGVKVNDEAVTSVDVEASEGVVKVGKRKFLRISYLA